MHYQGYTTDALMYITHRPDLVFERGAGSWLFDQNGKAYLDFVQGWAVNCLGHCPPEIRDALAQQAQKLINPSPAFYNAPMIELACLLTDRANSCFDRVFFANTGAEANEGAIKLARKWGRINKGGAYEIITFDHSFHGRTLATMSASGKAGWDTLYAPQVPGFPKAVYNALNSVDTLINEQTVAVMLEPVQGEGGVIPVDPVFLKELRELTRARGILLIVDEVQSGMGRTGKLFAYEWAGIEPDVMAVAKGIGGGFPLGACLATEKAASGMVVGTHGSTYGGNPLAMAVGLAIMEELAAPEFLAQVSRAGGRLRQGLEGLIASHPEVFVEVRGEGLMLGLVCRKSNAEYVTAGRAAGVLLAPGAENVARVLPPLNISDAEIDEALRRLDKAALAVSAAPAA